MLVVGKNESSSSLKITLPMANYIIAASITTTKEAKSI